MLNYKPRFAVFAAFFLAISLLTLAFSPPVRAALVQFLGSYNGVNVSINPDTDSLVVSGNQGAVLYQDANELFIVNGAGNEGIAVIRPDTQTVPLASLLAQHRDFEVPGDIPAGYSADGDGIRFEYEGRTGLMVLWHNAAGESITFYRGEQPADEVGTVEMSYVVTADLQGNDHAQLTWEADGFFYQIIASDETMSEATLVGIVP